MATLLSTLFGLWLLTMVTRLFLKGTAIGRILLSMIKSTITFIKLSFKFGKGTIKVSKKVISVGYQDTKKFYSFINSKYKALEKKDSKKEELKKVANGNFSNVISLDSFRNKKNK